MLVYLVSDRTCNAVEGLVSYLYVTVLPSSALSQLSTVFGVAVQGKSEDRKTISLARVFIPTLTSVTQLWQPRYSRKQ